MNSEIRTFTKSGEIRWEHIFAHPVWGEKENRLIQIVGAVQDITEQKQAEEALRKSETIYRQAIEVAGAVPYHQTFDENGNIHYDFMSEGIRQITGYGPEEFNDTLWGSLVQERHLLEELAEYSLEDAIQMVRSGKNLLWKCEHCIKARDGKIHWVFEAAVDLRDEHGIARGSVGLYQDITERKQAELERETLIGELEAKNAELERYTYTVSHDLKSPLVTIRGFLGYLENDALAGNIEKVKDDVKRIERATKKMHALLNDLLELSRIGRLINKSTDTLFTDIAKDAIDLVQGQIEARDVIIEIQNTPAIVYGDRTRLTEVIQNLVDNAVKFMGDQPKPHITIGVTTNEKYETIFFVRDNGIGIDSQYHERIFTLFSKLNSGTEGTGIGLTLIKRIIEVHNGHIWLESDPGKGTTFYFTLNQS